MEHLHTTFKALGGDNEISLWGPTQDECRNLADQLQAEVMRIEKKFSRYNSESIISRINSAAGQEAVEVDDETGELLNYAAACFTESRGLFDITSGVLRQAWNFRSGEIPTQAQIDSLLPLIGWTKVEWHAPLLKLTLPGMEIDFGGIGKEYAVDRLASLVRFPMVALINLSGDIRCTSTRPDSQPWRIGINHPRKPGAVLGHLELSSGAVATSGDYERSIQIDGERYCHILNPKTGWPVRGIQSTTVVHSSCLLAGTAATLSMLHRGVGDLKRAGLTYVAVLENGKIVSNNVSAFKASN